MGQTEPYSYRFTRSALRQLRRCPKAEAINRWIKKAADEPFRSDNNVKPLTGVPNGYRRRFGNWRVSYLVDQQGRLIEVFEIAPRGGAYK